MGIIGRRRPSGAAVAVEVAGVVVIAAVAVMVVVGVTPILGR